MKIWVIEMLDDDEVWQPYVGYANRKFARQMRDTWKNVGKNVRIRKYVRTYMF